MVRLQVGLDFDGVIVVDRAAYFLKFLQEVKGWGINLTVFMETGIFPLATGKEKPEIDAAYVEFVVSEHAPRLKVNEGARQALRRLQEVCDYHLVTSRVDNALLEAVGCFRSIDISLTSYTGGCYGKKSEVMQKRLLDVHVDDSPHEIGRMAEGIPPGGNQYLIRFPSFATPIDAFEAHPNIIRPDVCDEVTQVAISNPNVSLEIHDRLLAIAWSQVEAAIRNIVSERELSLA